MSGCTSVHERVYEEEEIGKTTAVTIMTYHFGLKTVQLFEGTSLDCAVAKEVLDLAKKTNTPSHAYPS